MPSDTYQEGGDTHSHEQPESAVYNSVGEMHQAVPKPLPNITECQQPQTNDH
jgi:hypothetical protein